MSGMFGIETPRRNDNRHRRPDDQSDAADNQSDAVDDQSHAGDFLDSIPSFVEPAPKNLKTEFRQPFKAVSNNIRKGGEFTPILQTATKKPHRLMRYDTPGQGSDKSRSILEENSALTPIHWNAKQANIDVSRLSMNKSSPVPEESHSGPGGIREQEKVMTNMKKENFELKLKVFLLEKQMYESSPEHVQNALKENIDYKVQVSSLKRDVNNYKKALTETERKVASLGDQVSASLSQEECQLPHGSSEEERKEMERLLMENEELIVEKEEADMRIRELEEDLDNMNHFKERSVKLQDDFDMATSDLQELRRQYEKAQDFEEKITQSRERIQDLEDEIRSLTAKNDVLNSKTQSETNNMQDALREQVAQKLEIIENMTAQTIKLERELHLAQSQTETLSDRLQALEARNDSLEANVEDRSIYRSAADEHNQALEMQKTTLELQIAALTDGKRVASEKLTSMEDRIRELEDELRERKEDIEELKGIAEDRSFEFRQLEDRVNSERESEESGTRDIVHKLEDQISESRLAAREQERELRDMNRKISALEDKLHDSEQKSHETNALVQQLQGELAAKAQQLQSLDRELVSVHSRNATLVSRGQELEQEIRELEASDDVDTTQVQDRLREDNQELRETIEELQIQLREKEEELDIAAEEASQMTLEIAALLKRSSEDALMIKDYEHQVEMGKSQVLELQRLLQSAQDKVIVADEARARVQQQLADAKTAVVQGEQKSEALNKSLVNVRGLLSDTQASHKIEVQAATEARQAERIASETHLAELESKLSAQISVHERSLENAHSVRVALEQNLSDYRDQISSLEHTIQTFSDAEQNNSVDRQHFKDALIAETARHERSQRVVESQLEELDAARALLNLQLESQHAELQILRTQLQTAKASELRANTEMSELRQQMESMKISLSATQDNARHSEERNLLLERLSRDSEAKIIVLEEKLASNRREYQNELLKRSDDLFAEVQKTNELTEKMSAIENKCLQHEQERKRLALALASADQRVLTGAAQLNDMTQQKNELDRKLGDYTEKDMDAAILESERSQLRNELSILKESLRANAVELEEVAAERDLLQEQVDEITDSDAQYRQETAVVLRTLREELKSTQSNLTTELEHSSKTQAQMNARLVEERAAAQQEHKRLDHIVADLQESLKQVKQNHSDLLSNLTSSTTQVASLHQQIRDLENELSGVRQAHHTYTCDETEHAQLLDEIETLEHELEHAKTEAMALQAQLKTETGRLSPQEHEDLGRLREERDLLLDDLEQSKKHSAELLTKQEQLQLEIRDMKIQQHDKETTRFDKPSSVHTSNDSARARAGDLDDVKRQLSVSQRENSAQKNNVKLLEIEIARQRKAEVRLHEQAKQTSRRVRTLETDLESKERKINELRVLVAQKAEHSAALEQRLSMAQSQSRPNSNISHQVMPRGASDKESTRRTDEMAGLTKMLRYMRSRTTREESFRSDLIHIKSYYDKQISSFEACNQANLSIIQQIGIYPDESFRTRKLRLKTAVHAIMATIKMKNAAAAWAIERAEKAKIDQVLQARKTQKVR